MTAKLADTWQKYNLLMNKPTGVAEIVLGVASKIDMNGKAIYIEGDRGWELKVTKTGLHSSGWVNDKR
jgi:hypothetical protein